MPDEVKYIIFISSTFRDLETERLKVSNQILSMGHIPEGMESFSASNADKVIYIEKKIDLSDYYIIIVGDCYGSTDTDGVSFTEKEYDYAIKNKVPVLAFIKSCDVSNSSESAESQEKLKAFINKILSERVVNHWVDENDLVAKVSTSLQQEIKSNPQIGWVRADYIPELVDDLKKELQMLKNSIPSLELFLNDEEDLELNFNSINFKPLEKVLLSEEDIPNSLKTKVSLSELDNYNSSLPSSSEYVIFNQDKYRYELIQNNKCPVNLFLYNNGHSVAKNIYVDLFFPEDFIILEKSEVDNLKSPKLDLPINPISKHQCNPLYGSFGLTNTTPYGISTELLRSSVLHYIPPSSRLTIRKNNVSFYKDELIHSRYVESDEFFIVPMKKGEFSINVTIVCEEYPNPIETDIKINVI